MHLGSTADIIDVNDSDNLVFLEAEWIGNKKEFPTRTNIPQFIFSAYTKAFAVPPSLENRLPDPTISVLTFTEFQLPLQTATPSFIKATAWFSQDSPNSNLITLLSRPIPHGYLLHELEEISGQAWFDTCQSIVDCRYNNNTIERFPLSALSLWRKLQAAISAQQRWAASLDWLSARLLTEEPTGQGHLVFRCSQDILAHLPYNGDVETKGVKCVTLELTRFIGQLGEAAWLSSDLLDLAVEDLNHRLANVVPDTQVLIGNLLMMPEIRRAVKGKGMSKKVYHIGKRASSGAITDIYLITLISKHWVTIYVNIAKGVITYGDSFDHPQQYRPTNDMLSVQKWLNSFGIYLQVEGPSLPHGIQTDGDSCGIFVLNMIAHAVFGDALLKSEREVGTARAAWFNVLANKLLVSSQGDITISTSRADGANGTGQSRMDLTFLCGQEPVIANGAEFEEASEECMLESLSILPTIMPSLEETPQYDTEIDVEDSPNLPVSSIPPPKLFPLFTMGYRPPATVTAKGKKPATQMAVPSLETSTLVVGTSKSAQNDRVARAAHEAGTYRVNTTKERNWRQGVLDIDGRAQFKENDVMTVLCSKCKKWRKVGTVYNKYRYKDHFNKCKGTFGSQRTMHELKEDQGVVFGTHNSRGSVTKITCPGLSKGDDERIASYLQRTMAPGGGGRALHKIALEMYGAKYSELDEEKQEIVDNVQVDGHLWRNDFRRGRVYALSCEREIIISASASCSIPPHPCTKCTFVLNHADFHRLIQKDATQDKNFIFVNHRYRDAVMGEKYAQTLGLRDILTAPSKLSIFLRYTIGVNNGTYRDNKILSGMVEACIMQQDKERRGVGMQGFRWSNTTLADYDRMLHVLYIESPAAYRHFAKYMPARTERSFQIMDGKAPKFPMTICKRSFELVTEQLRALDYHGPMALSWDDTKLLPAFRLYWNPKEKSYFLVGDVEGPIRVADPEMARAITEDPSHVLGTKVRLFCLQIPLAGVAPLMVAAIPVPDNLDVLRLAPYTKSVLYGLLDHDVHVASCCCDGTENERAIQRSIVLGADSYLTYKVPSPADPKYELEVVVAIIRGHPIVMIQDSLHARKTFRNNLFSGARLLALGNHVALYRHIRQITFEEGSPLYHRDVEKLDRQDDNAAARLFSAATLKFFVTRHPEYLGDIVFLFIFGELPDAYQNREISHLERMKIIFRAYYFVRMWQSFLLKAGYPESRYCLSREALDITDFLIRGLFGLTVIHRDRYASDQPFPLLPWFHGTDACEHTFGCSRSIVTDFALLEFYFMIQKARTKMHEGFLLAKSSADPKARAVGYNHTYMDSRGMDLQVLGRYPTSKEISNIACVAFEEAEALVALLGLVPAQLHRDDPTFVSLPGFDSLLHDGFSTDDKPEEYDDDDPDCAAKLRSLLREDHWHRGLSDNDDEKLTSLSLAAMSLTIDDMLTVANLPDDDIEVEKGICAQERGQIRSQIDMVLPSMVVDEVEKPFGKGHFSIEKLDLSFLVAEREKHQTRQAERGTRTRSIAISEEPTTHTARRALLKGFQDVLREQQDRGTSTGKNREARWHEGGIERSNATGNSANAAAVSASVAREALKKREKLFEVSRVPSLALIRTAQISTVRPIKIGHYGIIYGENTFGVAVGRVEALYAKSGGKNAKHGSVKESSDIGALSHIAVQVYEYMYGRKFRAIPQATSALQTNQFWLLPPLSFLCLLNSTPELGLNGLVLHEKDEALYKELNGATTNLKAAMVLSRKRGKRAVKINDE